MAYDTDGPVEGNHAVKHTGTEPRPTRFWQDSAMVRCQEKGIMQTEDRKKKSVK